MLTDNEQLLKRVHSQLYKVVGKATESIIDMENVWTRPELVKCLVRFIFKAAPSPELADMRWDEIARRIVQNVMDDFSAVCGETQHGRSLWPRDELRNLNIWKG